MDLQRSILKVLFYDFAPEWVAESLDVDINSANKHFFERTVESMKWREQKFTLSELTILQSWMDDELLNDNDIGMDKISSYSAYERVFIPGSKLGGELLDISSSYPRVKYRHLLRWRDLTLMIGEDLMALAALARHDCLTGMERSSFTWSNVLPHNDLKLNGILAQTLSDTHAHLNASTDVFDFNWIVVMNHHYILSILREDKYKSRFTGSGPHQEYDTVSRNSDIKMSVLEWIEIAAVVRMRILFLIFNIKVNKNAELPSMDFKDILLLDKLRDEFTGNYSILKDHILTTHNGIKFDYAIIDWKEYGFSCPMDESAIKSPFMILHGERNLLYQYFRYYFGGNEVARRFAPYVYLYLIIKNKIRRELTQTNSLIGFGNFKVYQDLKFMFVDLLSKKDKKLRELYTDIALKYAIQAAVINTTPNYFEARVMPTEVDKIRRFNYQKSIFGNGKAFDADNTPYVSLVAHFSKSSQRPNKPEGEIRHKKLRQYLNAHTDKLILSFSINDYDVIPFVGIDAAGNELSAPPEVFAISYKKLRERGIPNFTYHVGEDFYDLIHGLRSIDEAITFLNLSTNNRLGHALALGVDVKRYYEDRHNCGILPKQVMLDNIVWLKYQALKWNIVLQPETQLFIEKNFEELTEELGYEVNGVMPSIYHYWESMMLRGEDVTNPSPDENAPAKRKILDLYLFSKTTFEEGAKTKIFDFPKSIWKDVCSIQERLLDKVEQTGIIIETNPSSNYKIGPFKMYSELPIFRMHVPGHGNGHHLPVTVNTDDKGVFATSLENEYSLLAISLRKQRDNEGKRIWSDKDIEEYIKQLVEYGNISRFRL